MSTERRNPKTVDIDLFPTERILKIINAEDAMVAGVVATAIPDIAKAVDLAAEAVQSQGRIFYLGAGTSGRMAVLDAAECPPTFGTPKEMVQALMPGGGKAFTQADEGTEDDNEKAAADLKAKKLSGKDIVLGIAASGTTPYTLAGLQFAKTKGAKTVAVVCVDNSPMSKVADVTIYTAVGPEVITGSSRMKAGTAQKLVLNMISTATMIRLGMTYSNWMINVSMTNRKLRERGKNILREILAVKPEQAEELVEKSGGALKVAVIMGATGCTRKEAERKLSESGGHLRRILAHLGSGRE
jgi:N-acetylmuramic acid 6-phosphate etherase